MLAQVFFRSENNKGLVSTIGVLALSVDHFLAAQTGNWFVCFLRTRKSSSSNDNSSISFGSNHEYDENGWVQIGCNVISVIKFSCCFYI